MTDSDLEIESLTREPDSVIEEFMESTSNAKDESKTGTNCLNKGCHIDSETNERVLGIT